jgi:hypothetical protein
MVANNFRNDATLHVRRDKNTDTLNTVADCKLHIAKPAYVEGWRMLTRLQAIQNQALSYKGQISDADIEMRVVNGDFLNFAVRGINQARFFLFRALPVHLTLVAATPFCRRHAPDFQRIRIGQKV